MAFDFNEDDFLGTIYLVHIVGLFQRGTQHEVHQALF